ncbi:hypothetical protein PR202_gb02400 [Eleusine coracana subsp. coracana]|uniref:YTH domain-containing family protein n=1 Tax=Eleusine coracana subsp. coracana TaxID=191504 RepID=A0AAV5DZ64_ELECO|nr:hypothetical protein PR202_gb02400 [Eleusine coracana subsp. coracana]
MHLLPPGQQHATRCSMDKQEPVADVEPKIVLAEKPKEQPVPSKDEKAIVPPISVDSNAIDLPSEGQAQAGTSNIGGDHNAAYQHNFYASQTQPFYYQGSGQENSLHEWDAYPPYMSAEGLEVGPPVVYNEDPSLMFHGGYGYDPYAPYSPITTPVPAAVSGDGQLYSPQQFSFSAPYYQQSASPHQKPFYGFGSPNDSYGRGFSHGGIFPQASNYGGPFPSFSVNGRSSFSVEKGRRRGRGNALICSCNGPLDFLNEQSRGPRATRPKQPDGDSKDDKPSKGPDRELYNRQDFVTEYKNARFFIIKSYSEDNVHKSIKYGVWASTTNGNKKLDSAYHEAKEKEEHCPIFLLFSVNASAQFCGVAEMIGPVDFEKSVDYWQQDKWTGQFPVKWHIVKDVPNNLFRHIILENNDNKPVTNSRDTQEVKLEQGLEMLKILKNHDDEASILDDFDFYEEREKALLENKARLHHPPSSAVVEPKKPLAMPTDLVGHITKSFAQAVRLGEAKTVADKGSAGDSSIAVKPIEVKDGGLS